MEYGLLLDLLILVAIILLGLFIQKYLPSYFQEKAKNLATKEDINAITSQVEKIKNAHKNHYDLTRSERDFYSQLINAIQKLLSEIKRYELNQKKGENFADKAIIMADRHLKESWLEFVDSANEILASAYVFLSEESYGNLIAALKDSTTFKDIRHDLLNAMRQSIHSKTKFRAEVDSRDLKY